MDDLQALASRIETEPPSRALDAEIWEAIGLTEVQEWHCRDWRQRDGRADLTRGCYLLTWAPRYTASLDVAVSLTIEGWFMDVHQSITEPQEWVVMLGRFPADGEVMGAAPTLAQAIAAAWLRARATTTEQATQTGGGENG